jgi:NADH dehydrogenase FAD-containing subunit
MAPTAIHVTHPQVGGGPTGVEAAAEMHDLISDDLLSLFPEFKVIGCCQASAV